MTCYICGNSVASVMHPDSEEIPCPDCGRYRITRASIELLRLHNWRFDTYLVRRWVADQLEGDTIPLIDSNIVARLVKL